MDTEHNTVAICHFRKSYSVLPQ